ncbi:glycoside hydrolase [Trichodelitschia bisporula]|uniref:mannan endo-1,4-beta-mannosidase n=1 Tax=Trichodelitschia bisporula TaxID=703511 RepID=A0A6G1I9D5_9PEZI|nr:glycoside hydrolase [Trichodelitschia bisporula]
MKSAVFLSLATAVAARLFNGSHSNFPRVDGFKFNIDGKTEYFRGTNAYWLPFLAKSEDIDLTLDHMAEANLKVVRVWGFNDVGSIPTKGTVWFQSFITGSEPVINTGPDGLQKLDYVIDAAEKRGIKLIIPFVNNWEDYGGMAQYVRHYGGSLPSEWYGSEPAQVQYRKYIKAVISRRINSSAIFAWELANEPRCQGCNTTVIAEWAAKTSKYIKSLDPHHMVAAGDEGFGIAGGDGATPYLSVDGGDFKALVEIPDIDFGTFHLYPDHWGIDAAWGNTWIQNHAKACIAAKKPCVFEEYGMMDTDKCPTLEGWQRLSSQTPGMAGDMYWQYGDKLSIGDTADDKFTIYRNSPNWKCGTGKRASAQ